MNRTFKAAVAGLVLAIGFAGPVAAGPWEDAGVAYDKGDYATVLRLIRPLADQGDAHAQFNLGQMYREGQGVPKDYAAAASWYRKAAELGWAEAQHNLGLMYVQGEGVPQDYAAALNWFWKAAEQGVANAQYSLGVMYIYGQGVPQDYVTAHMWLNLAAAAGAADKAAEARDLVAKHMTPTQIAEAQRLASEWKPKSSP